MSKYTIERLTVTVGHSCSEEKQQPPQSPLEIRASRKMGNVGCRWENVTLDRNTLFEEKKKEIIHHNLLTWTIKC